MNSGQFYPSFHQGLDQGMLDQQPPSLSPFHMPMQQLPPPPHHHHSHMSPYAMTAMPAPIPRAKGQRRGVRRNPEAPKRPMSPYVTFVKDKWKSVHLSLPGAAAKDVMRTLGEQWNALPAAEKEKWKALSDEDKARYASRLVLAFLRVVLTISRLAGTRTKCSPSMVLLPSPSLVEETASMVEDVEELGKTRMRPSVELRLFSFLPTKSES